MRPRQLATLACVDVLGLTFSEATERLAARPSQIDALRKHYARALRTGCASGPFSLELQPVTRSVRDGGLVKFVQASRGGFETESVVIPMQRHQICSRTLCVSSQVGCARGCTFCETAQIGLRQQLSPEEIVGQVVAARALLGAEIRNVVFMGMGEPFDNFDNVAQAVRVMNDHNGLSIGMPRITISTVGRVDGIRRLREMNWPRINLAVSLNAPNDEIRRQIMPISLTDPMPALREALLSYPRRNCQFFMIEYVLIPGVNDAPQHARELAEYTRPIPCCVNVIPYNPRLDSPWPAPSEADVVRFMEALQAAGQYCKRRVTRGREQMAACGQLGNRAYARGGHASADRMALPQRVALGMPAPGAE